MIRKSIILLTAILIALAMAVPAVSEDPVRGEPVATTEGPVIGKIASNPGAWAYLGIPYAAPPVGELRFKPPMPPIPRTEPIEAFEFGPSCVQDENFGAGGKSASFSEDCLTLNIWRPAKPGKYPVMFWIHGGGMIQGSSSYNMYNGANMAAEKDVVVVSINYRLGILGFLALESLAEEDANDSTGNYGMLDQLQALKWVRDNIANFGGDPDNVTIFGHSAGGVSVCNLVATPLGEGLFHKAIQMSGACDFVVPMEGELKKGVELAESMGCSGDGMLECLRSKPVKNFKKPRIITPWAHVDGYVLKDYPVESIRKGEYNKVPVIVGSNKDEMDITYLFAPFLKCATKKMIRKKVYEQLGEDLAGDLLRNYPLEKYDRPIRAITTAVTEGFASRAYALADALAAAGQTDVWLYRFDWDDERWGKTIGAFHGVELPLLFGNLELPVGLRIGTLYAKEKIRKIARPVSRNLMSYWTNFGKTGNPNGDGLPDWTWYTRDGKRRLHIDNEITTKPIPEKQLERFDFLNSHRIAEYGGVQF